MTSFENDREGDPRMVKSEPPSPKKEWPSDEPLSRNNPLDNVYADSKPSDPLAKIGKTFTDADSQVNPNEFGRVLSRKGVDFFNLDGFEISARRRDKTKKRGRKN